MTHSTRHGGPHDRGGADFWYGRQYDPHFFKGATHGSERVELKDMTAAEITSYSVGFKTAEEDGGQKDWG